MLNSYHTEKLLWLQEVEVKNILENEESFEISIEQPRKTCIWLGKDLPDMEADYVWLPIRFDENGSSAAAFAGLHLIKMRTSNYAQH